MEAAKAKAAVLIEALPYLQMFRGRTMVVKFGGAAMNPQGDLADILFSLVFLSHVGIRPVLVHGGGQFISQAMKEKGLQPTFVRGRRVTDAATLAIVEDVLINKVNAQLVARIEGLGGSAVGLHSRHGRPLLGEKLLESAEDGTPVDLGLVGRVFSVRTAIINDVLDADCIPVIAPLAVSVDGQTLNCNADTVSWKVAAELKAEKLVILSDVPGILRDRKDESTLIPTVTKEEVERLEREAVIDGGMLPKVDACLRAVEAGVRKAHMIDGRIPHALLLEIFTDTGVGTEIIRSRE
ncbi:MAG: acetylglutamate kinase [Planctomycetes bacterium]|nr:acetylglutamate kinase [Planctomycetota bacterium]